MRKKGKTRIKIEELIYSTYDKEIEANKKDLSLKAIICRKAYENENPVAIEVANFKSDIKEDTKI